MKVTDAKKRIFEQLQNRVEPKMSKSASSILFKAATEQFKMQRQFKNLEDPLLFLKNQCKQQMKNQTMNLSIKLQNQMSQTAQFSKSIYKKMISNNEDYLNFFKNQADLADKIDKIQMSEVLKTQKYLRQLSQKSQSNSLMKSDYLKLSIKKGNQQKGKRSQKMYCHANEIQNKENISQNLTQDINYDQIKNLDNDKKINSSILSLLKPIKQYQNQRPVGQAISISKNQQIQKIMSKMKFDLVKQSNEFSQKSKQLYFDFENNLNFWDNPIKFDHYNNKLIEPQMKDTQVLSYFTNFKAGSLDSNNMCDIAMRKITPKMIDSYYNIKKQHYLKLQMEKRDQNLDEKYQELVTQMQKMKQSKSKDKPTKLPTRSVNKDVQTVKDYSQNNPHRYYNDEMTVEDVLNKIKKLNSARQRAMRGSRTTTKVVIIKNACREISSLLFKLLIFMLKDQTFHLNQQTSNKQKDKPLFTYSDLLTVENKDQAERKILQLIYTNINFFKVQKVDATPKKQIISVYVDQRQKNNKILDIIHSKK